MEDEISLFVGKNPVLGMLKPLQSLAAFLSSGWGFPGNHYLAQYSGYVSVGLPGEQILSGKSATSRGPGTITVIGIH
jgi:hypothetical protein